MKSIFLSVIFCAAHATITFAQAPSNQEAIVGFYNLENLFDTEDDPTTNDKEFLPDGANQWTPERYQQKLKNMARVIGNFGPSLLGLGEIENRKVLEDLVSQPAITAKRYQIAHFDMKDPRGVDVALLYQPAVFKPFLIRLVPIHDPEDPGFITRDILWVKGLFMGDTLHVAVNHWPSRRGGKEDKRLVAARALRQAVDSVLAINSKANIVIMGDMNDDPNNRSIKKILTAPNTAGQDILINTAEPTFKKGRGTLYFDGVWNLFDQIIISSALNDRAGCDYVPDSFTIAAYAYMIETSGKSKGMPMRTFRGGVYNPDGYSDHFPVFIRISKGN